MVLNSIGLFLISLGVAFNCFASEGLQNQNEFFRHEFSSENERVGCLIDVELGKSSGEIEFEKSAYDCGSYYSHAESIGKLLESSRLFLVNTVRTKRDLCFRSGWLMGIVESSQKMLETCEGQLSEARQIALQKRINECKAEADVVKADSETLGQLISKDLSFESQDDKEFRQAMILYVRMGASETAWIAMIEKQKNQDYGALPCAGLLYQN